mgnify:CR=1 FL=1
MKHVVVTKPTERLRHAELRHRELDTKILELRQRAYLSPEQQIEVARLKKLKLHTKDEITALRAHA